MSKETLLLIDDSLSVGDYIVYRTMEVIWKVKERESDYVNIKPIAGINPPKEQSYITNKSISDLIGNRRFLKLKYRNRKIVNKLIKTNKLFVY